ncbi:MAG: hypothetical protein O2807_14050, partial [bacterium]|nr:hypothetical protein [bacterium]
MATVSTSRRGFAPPITSRRGFAPPPTFRRGFAPPFPGSSAIFPAVLFVGRNQFGKNLTPVFR